MNTKPTILKEEDSKTVNTVQLSDLFSSASKVETSIIQLSTMAVNFSNPAIKKKVQQLRSIGHELNDMIADAMTGAEMQASAVDGKQDLDARTDDKEVIPEQQAAQPTLSESEKRGRQIIELMMSAGMSLTEAKEFVLEYGYTPPQKHNYSRSTPDVTTDLKQDEQEEAPTSMSAVAASRKGEAPYNPNSGKMPHERIAPKTGTPEEFRLESIDLSEAYALVGEHGLLRENFEKFCSVAATKLSALKEHQANIAGANSFDALNEALDALYDYADNNNIQILN